MFGLPLSSPSQNDHLATDRQADDPAEQSQRVPPELHTAVFINCHFSSSVYKKRRNPPITTKRTQPIRIYLSLIISAFSLGGSGGLCDDALLPRQLSHLDIHRRGTVTCPKTKQNEEINYRVWYENMVSTLKDVCTVGLCICEYKR